MNNSKEKMKKAIHSVNEQLQIIRSNVEHLTIIADLDEESKKSLDNISNAVIECSMLINKEFLKLPQLPVDKVTTKNMLKLKNRNVRILIIEDEDDLASLFSSNLDYFGLKTYAVSNFYDGLDIIEKEKIDIVILDIMLPDAYGLDCIDTILEKNESIKIVVVTGKIDELDKDLDYLKGKCSILTKPFSVRALLAAML